MSEQHLGDDVHDLLDNRLSAARACAAMRHLEECPDCRMRWDDLREAREALQTSSAGIDMTFAQQLLDRDRMAEIAKEEPRHQARAARGRDRRPMLTAVILVVAVTAGVGAAYFAGEPDEVSLEFAEESTVTVAAGGDVTYMEARSMRGGDDLRSWVHPDWDTSGLRPVEGAVMRSPSGDKVLVATILANLEPIVITEQHGRLSAAFAEHYASVDLGHTRAYIVSDNPRQLVWQTGDVVISATCSCALSTLEAVAACFPAQSNPGFVDRVAEGLREFAAFATPDR